MMHRPMRSCSDKNSAGKIFLFLLVTLGCLECVAQKTIVLSDSKKFYEHGNSFVFFEDKLKKFSSLDFTRTEFLDEFKPATDRNFNFGLTSSAIWYKFSLYNATGERWL